MLDYKTSLVIIGGLNSLITSALFIRTIIKKQTIPHLYSQIIWTITVTISFLGQVYDNSGVGTWILFLIDCGVITILFLSIKYGIKEPTKWDKIFLTLALVSMIPRILTKNPLYSVILVTFIDVLGYFPILNKIKRYPNSEVLYPRIIGNISFITGFIGLNHISILSALYITVSFSMNFIVIFSIIYFKYFRLGTLKIR
ncbi:MAG: hypothetical protein PHN31_05565 [Candidatus Gracilibacteria bacterium]|nr:hypothetical protein [Candidatus Gracilibacteria bacterium]